jgi:PKD repeat protein
VFHRVSPVSSSALRALLLALLAALAVAGSLAIAPPAHAAAPVAPWFGPNVYVNAPPAYSGYQPSIAAGSSGTLYLAYGGWGGSTTGSDIFFSKSTDGGRTWTSPMRVNNDGGTAVQMDPSLFVDAAGAIYVVWTDFRGLTSDIYFSKSTDGGLSFSANVRVNDIVTNTQVESDIAVDAAGLVHAVWTDNRNAATTGPDIYYGNSTDGGLSFDPSQRVNNDAGAAEQARPAIGVAPDRSVYAVWDDPRNAARGRDVYFSKSTDLGGTWTPNIIVNDDVGNIAQDNAAIAVDPAGSIFVTWADSRNPNGAPDIFASRSTNGGASFAANVPVNDDSGTAFQTTPSIHAVPGKVQIVWADARTAGSTGWDIYTASSPDGIAWDPNLRVNDDDHPFNYQQTPTVAIGPAGDVFAAWLDSRVSGQDVFAATLDLHGPTADAGENPAVDQGSVVAFDGAASTDNFGIASYAWDFGDGTTVVGRTASRAFPTPGAYAVMLTVWDFSGNVDSDTITVTVRDTQAPVARGGGDRTVDEDQPVFFDASASTDNVAIDSFAWNFGDGNVSTDAAVTHIYERPGTYTVTLTVTDTSGNVATSQMTATVREVSPTSNDLLAMIHGLQGLVATLQAIAAVLGVALGFVVFLAFSMWRRQQAPPPIRSKRSAPSRMPPPPPREGPSSPPEAPEDDSPPPPDFNL